MIDAFALDCRAIARQHPGSIFKISVIFIGTSHERRGNKMNVIHAQIAEFQKKLDTAKKELRDAVGNLDMDDQIILELRAHVRNLACKLHELDSLVLKR